MTAMTQGIVSSPDSAKGVEMWLAQIVARRADDAARARHWFDSLPMVRR